LLIRWPGRPYTPRLPPFVRRKELKKELCGKRLPKAANGADRGFCTRQGAHIGRHGNNTCYTCGTNLTVKNSSPSHRQCRKCINDFRRELWQRQGRSPRNLQIPGSKHVFPCGCSGFLPSRGKSNKFAARSGRAWSCRVLHILHSSLHSAKENKHKPVDQGLSHSVIRKMMEESDCWRCHKSLVWKLGLGKTPHLHHNHNTGEIYGFTHPRCNPNVLEQEVDELREELFRLQKKVA